MTINIHLDGSRLWIEDPRPVLADGTANKVRFRLSPDSEWDGLTITVIFRRVYAIGVDTRKVVISNVGAAYAVPHEVLHDGWLYIGAVGVAQNGEVRLTTAKLESPLKVSASEDGDADWAGSITPEVADQILALIGTVSNLDTTDKSSLVAAINEVLGRLPADFVTSVAGKTGDVTLDAADISANVEGIPARNVAVALAYLLDIIRRLDARDILSQDFGGTVYDVLQDLIGDVVKLRESLLSLNASKIPATFDDVEDVSTVYDALLYLQELAQPCVVNMTKNADGTYTADKTFAALKAAHDAGQTVICSFDDRTNTWDSPYRLPVVDTTDVHMGFAGVIEPRQNYKIFAYVYINSSGMGHTATEITTNDTVSTMIAAAIGDTATALSDMDSVIGGAGA